jgi:peptidyl-tRNA hydrolase, PTH1 family
MNMLEEDSRTRAVVGLGNFGDEYEITRHNAGFWTLDQLASENGASFAPFKQLQAELATVEIEGISTLLVKPNTGIAGMNSSGVAVKAVLDHFNINPTPDNFLVVYDEIELSGLRVNLVSKKSRLHHNGVKSVYECLGEETRFARLRIAVGPPPENGNYKAFALGKLEDDALKLFEQNCHLAATAVRCWLSQGIERATNKVNHKL